VRRREEKCGSALESCNGKLHNISDKTRVQSRDGNWGCRVWGRGEMVKKRAGGGEDDASIHLYSESMKSTRPKYAGR
jgi:hypothetical protein